MSSKKKNLSNSFSTGSGGARFESQVQASFVALMLSNGFCPCTPTWPIQKIKLQGKYDGYDTDDLIIFTKSSTLDEEAKLLGQIKHSINISSRDNIFSEIMQAAWNDFNNSEIFRKGIDQIALITGPLNTIIIKDVRTILEWARHSENATDFLKKVNAAKFSSNSKRKKLNAFRTQLKKANKGNEISDNSFWRFLKSFHLLGYDLDVSSGSTLSFAYSLITQFNTSQANMIWSHLVSEIQSRNQNAGTITKETLPEEITSVFKKKQVEEIPVGLAVSTTESELGSIELFISQSKYPNELVFSCLLGSWSEKNLEDIRIISKIVDEDYENWISKLRELLHASKPMVTLKNGIWKINNRIEILKVLGSRLYDNDLIRFKDCVVKVLSERDPKFELSPKDRFAADIYGKKLSHSYNLRKGLTEALAIIESNSKMLKNCSRGHAQSTVHMAVREILTGADWILWGTLNDLLPILAEAAPQELINNVESAISNPLNPFLELFSQEDDSITGSNYLTGLLWALETLAWDEQYLSSITVILGELATIDPGGSWANRPINSLITIFLPWLPQTISSIEKRKAAIKALNREQPKICWALILKLLPNQHQTSSGSRKPVWRNTIPKDWKKEVTKKEYWEQAVFYAELAVKLSKTNYTMLQELLEHLNNIPKNPFNDILTYLATDEIINLDETKRTPIWSKLIKFILKHRKFSDTKWALPSKVINKIEIVANKLAPKDPLNMYKRLFNTRGGYDLFEKKGDWKEQQKKVLEKRIYAAKEIVSMYNISALVDFSQTVGSPWDLGFSLGHCIDDSIDRYLLPKYLNNKKSNVQQFLDGFIQGRFNSQGWDWFGGINLEKWDMEEIAQILKYHPFVFETWKRVEKFIKKDENLYWSNVQVTPYRSVDKLNYAIDKLLACDRPIAAIACLHYQLNNKRELDWKQVIKALEKALSSNESANQIDSYQITELIKAMQISNEISPEDLFQVEWRYLQLLDKDNDAEPKLLENKLASEPAFFCELIRLAFRSNKDRKKKREVSKDKKALAGHAYTLLDKWHIPPGTDTKKIFSEKLFRQWINYVVESCKESGHLEIALQQIGNVLIYSPSDPGGLWINKVIAEVINKKEFEHMRIGYRLGIFNSRGAHWIDPTGTPEKELAKKYRQQAEEIEILGYHRFASTLRELSDSYNREAERIVEEHQSEK